MEKQKNSPQLRFPGFEGEWEEDMFSNLTIRIGDGLHGTPEYKCNTDFYFILEKLEKENIPSIQARIRILKNEMRSF